MRGPGRNKCLHGSCLWKHSPLDALIRAFLQERRSSSNIAGSDDCISSYIPCHCATHSLSQVGTRQLDIFAYRARLYVECGHLFTDSRASDMTLVLPHYLNITGAATPAASMD